MLNDTDMAERPFSTAAVVGAGLMGRRLAGVFASAGMEVRLTDVRPDLLDRAVDEANALADELATAKGGRAGRVVPSAELHAAVDGAEFVTEAVVEDLEVKRDLFARLVTFAPEAIVASNSSVLCVTDIAAGLPDASRTIGTHWWNPPDLIPIVEVIGGAHTSAAVVADVMNLMRALGKTPVLVRKDVPGFVGNRLQHALWREAIALVAEGVADAETVDLVVRGTIGLRLARLGPIENADYVGLDLTRAIHAAVFPSLDRSTEPSALLTELLDAGHAGAKSGQGLLAWPPGRRERVAAELAAHVRAGLRAQADDPATERTPGPQA